MVSETPNLCVTVLLTTDQLPMKHPATIASKNDVALNSGRLIKNTTIPNKNAPNTDPYDLVVNITLLDPCNE